MKTVHLLVILGGIFLLGVVGVYFIYANSQVLQYEEIQISYEVRDDWSIGFDTTNQSLAFGRSAPGGQSFRHVKIESAVPAEFYVAISGDALRHVRPEPSEGILDPGVPQLIRFTLYAPDTEGNYTGRAQIRVFRR